MNEEILHNPRLKKKGLKRRAAIQRLIIRAISSRGLNVITVKSDVIGPECPAVGSFTYAYPGYLEVAIQDALLNSNTSQPTSPEELSKAVVSDPEYWNSIIQGESGITPREILARNALTIRLADWPSLTCWHRAIVVAWIRESVRLPSADPNELESLLQVLNQRPPYAHRNVSA